MSHVLADLQDVFAGFEVDGVAASHRSVHTTTTRSKTMVDTSASVPTANSPSRSPTAPSATQDHQPPPPPDPSSRRRSASGQVRCQQIGRVERRQQ